jgi:hypothetical protein
MELLKMFKDDPKKVVNHGLQNKNLDGKSQKHSHYIDSTKSLNDVGGMHLTSNQGTGIQGVQNAAPSEVQHKVYQTKPKKKEVQNLNKTHSRGDVDVDKLSPRDRVKYFKELGILPFDDDLNAIDDEDEEILNFKPTKVQDIESTPKEYFKPKQAQRPFRR